MTGSTPGGGTGRGRALRALRGLAVRSGVLAEPDDAPATARDWVLFVAALVTAAGVVLGVTATPWALVFAAAALAVAGAAGRRRPPP